MQNLATDVLYEAKKKATFWKVATIITLLISIVELVVIVF